MQVVTFSISEKFIENVLENVPSFSETNRKEISLLCAKNFFSTLVYCRKLNRAIAYKSELRDFVSIRGYGIICHFSGFPDLSKLSYNCDSNWGRNGCFQEQYVIAS